MASVSRVYVYSYNRNVFTYEDFAPAKVTNCPDMGIVECASDINDQQDPRIQNISNPNELSEQESTYSTEQKFAKFEQPSTSSIGSYDILLRRLGKALYKKTYVSLHRYCLSQKLLQEKIHEKAEEKERHQGC